MENAIWNEKLVIAGEIAEDYAIEKEIRKASGRKELICPDPECEHSTLRYCHGDKKDPYFAHLTNTNCDYAIFDKETSPIIRTIRRLIYDHFRNKGYSVRLESKILPHHYTHLYFDMTDRQNVAIEIGTKQLSAKKIDTLTEAYHQAGISVNWIVLDDTKTPVIEKQTYFLKRFLLNETRNKDLLVINWNGSEIAQFKVDPNTYIYEGINHRSINFPETYVEYSTLDTLMFDENNNLSLEGFHQSYKNWLIKKQRAFDKKIKNLEKQKDADRHKNQRVEFCQEALAKAESNTTHQRKTEIHSNNDGLNVQSEINLDNSGETYEQFREEILPQMSQQNIQAIDSLGRRWVKCTVCGRIDTVNIFVSYGGMNSINLGVCNDCGKNKP